MEGFTVHWEVMEIQRLVTIVPLPAIMVTGGVVADGEGVISQDMVPNGTAVQLAVKVQIYCILPAMYCI